MRFERPSHGPRIAQNELNRLNVNSQGAVTDRDGYRANTDRNRLFSIRQLSAFVVY